MKKLTKLLFVVLCLALIAGVVAVVSGANDQVAAIGETGYATLAEAVEAAESGATITLLANTEAGNITVADKAIRIDLAGKKLTQNSTGDDTSLYSLFTLGENGKLTVIGEGTISVKNGPAFLVNKDTTGTEITVGDGTNAITVNDGAGNGMTIIRVLAGSFTAKNATVASLKLTNNHAVAFGATTVRIEDSTFANYAQGTAILIEFSPKVNNLAIAGHTYDFYAKNSIFHQEESAYDAAKKTVLFHFPSVQTTNTGAKEPNSGSGTGSKFVMDDCTVDYKWRGFVQDGGKNGSYQHCEDDVELVFNRCCIYMGAGNAVGGSDRGFAREMNATFTDCMFNDDNFRSAGIGEIGCFNNETITFNGVNKLKYNRIVCSVPAGKTLVFNGTPYTTSAGTLVPDGFGIYYCKSDTTGYPYYITTAEDVPIEDRIVVTTMRRESFTTYAEGKITAVDADGKATTSGYILPYGAKNTVKNAFIGNYITALNKVAVSGATSSSLLDTLTGEKIALTPYGSNRYFCFYAQNAVTGTDAKDSYIDFLAASDATFDKYNYFTWDFDITTESVYPTALSSSCMGRGDKNPTTNSDLGFNKNFLFDIRTDENGVYIKNGNSDKVYLDSTPYAWNHVSAVVYVNCGADENHVFSNDAADGDVAQAIVFLNGVRLNETPLAYEANNLGAKRVDGFRFSYISKQTTANAGDNVCIDNVVINAYDIVNEAGYSNPIAELFADGKKTLSDIVYPSYTSAYILPEKAPVALGGDAYFYSFREAYDFVASNGGGTLQLVRNSTEQIDIHTDLVLYTNGIDYQPTGDSWGFKRSTDNNGNAIYTFKEAYNRTVKILWYTNVFEPDEYVYIEWAKFGKQIEHPAADTNLLEQYIVDNGDGTFSLYTLAGWTRDPESGEPYELPVVAEEEVGLEEIEIYPRYVASPLDFEGKLYLHGENISLKILDPEKPEDENAFIEKKYSLFLDTGVTVDDFQNALTAAKDGAIFKMLGDFEISSRSINLPGVSLTIDLNGHTMKELSKNVMFKFSSKTRLEFYNSSETQGMLYSRAVNGKPDSSPTSYNWSVPIFNMNSDSYFHFDGTNIFVRCGIMLDNGNNYEALIENATIEGCVGDSKALFIARAETKGQVTIRNTTIYLTLNSSRNIVASAEDKEPSEGLNILLDGLTIYARADKTTRIVGDLAKGTTVTVRNTVGMYQMGGGTQGGKIVCGAGNQWFGNDGIDVVEFEENVVQARGWGNAAITYSYLNPYEGSAAEYDFNTVTMTVASKDAKLRYWSVNAEDAALCRWYDRNDPETILKEEVWYKNADPIFYTDAVPTYTDPDGKTWIFPRGGWGVDHIDDDGVYYLAQDMSLATLPIEEITGYKQNVSLYSDFRMNLFIPKYGVEPTVKVGGTTIPLTERVYKDVEYWVACVNVAADQAANNIVYTISYPAKYGNNSSSGNVNNPSVISTTKTLNVAAYAQALLGYENGDYGYLASAMIRYAKASYEYAHEGAQIPERLAIADAEEHAVKAKAKNTVVATEKVTGIAVNLANGKPVYVIYLNDYEGRIMINYRMGDGRVAAIEKELLGGEQYVAVEDIALYDFANTLTLFYEVDGEYVELGEYNLSAYFEALDGIAAETVTALYDYIEASRIYKYGA